MKFLPYERLLIHTTLSSEEVLKRLANVIEPERDSYTRLFEGHTKPYQGSIVGSHFEISRIIGYRNSMLPVIEGDIQSESSGCSVYITMQPQVLIILFTIFWLGGSGLLLFGALVSLVWSLIQPRIIDPSLVLIPGGLFVFGYVLFVGGFKFESIQSKKFLRELFEAKEVEEMRMGTANPFERAG